MAWVSTPLPHRGAKRPLPQHVEESSTRRALYSNRARLRSVLPASIREKVPLAFALEFLETVYDWNCFGFVPPQIDFTEYRALLPPDWDGWVRLLNAWLDYSEEGTTPPRGGLTKDEAAFNAACFEDVQMVELLCVHAGSLCTPRSRTPPFPTSDARVFSSSLAEAPLPKAPRTKDLRVDDDVHAELLVSTAHAGASYRRWGALPPAVGRSPRCCLLVSVVVRFLTRATMKVHPIPLMTNSVNVTR